MSQCILLQSRGYIENFNHTIASYRHVAFVDNNLDRRCQATLNSESTMVNKCAVFGCKRGYESKEKHDDYHAFYFPTGENKSHLLTAWEKFVARKDWNHTKNSVICEFHFEEKFILKGKRWTLK